MLKLTVNLTLADVLAGWCPFVGHDPLDTNRPMSMMIRGNMALRERNGLRPLFVEVK